MKLGLVQLERPAQAGLDRRDLFGQLVAVERHAGLEPQHVARAETARLEALRRAGLAAARARARGADSPSTKSSKPSSPV